MHPGSLESHENRPEKSNWSLYSVDFSRDLGPVHPGSLVGDKRCGAREVQATRLILVTDPIYGLFEPFKRMALAIFKVDIARRVTANPLPGLLINARIPHRVDDRMAEAVKNEPVSCEAEALHARSEPLGEDVRERPRLTVGNVWEQTIWFI